MQGDKKNISAGGRKQQDQKNSDLILVEHTWKHDVHVILYIRHF